MEGPSRRTSAVAYVLAVSFLAFSIGSSFSGGKVAAESSVGVAEAEKAQIDTWLKSNEKTLNRFGDPTDTMYAGSNPLFDEKSGETTDLHQYIVSKHSDKPWGAAQSASQSNERREAASKTAEEGTAASGSESPAVEEVEEAGGLGMVSMGLAVVVAAGIAGGAFFVMNNGKTVPKGSAVLLMGPSFSGKTSLFLSLKDGKVVSGATVTSMEPNEGSFRLANFDDDSASAVHVIDFPGDPGLSFRLPDFYPLAKVIVFMLDANDKKSIEREAAESMYRVLTNPQVVEQCPKIIVACNKKDLIMASKPPLLKKIFETELQKLTVTQGTAEDNVTDEDTVRESIPLVVEGENFEFEKHSPCPIEFIGCSVKAGLGMEELVGKIREELMD